MDEKLPKQSKTIITTKQNLIPTQVLIEFSAKTVWKKQADTHQKKKKQADTLQKRRNKQTPAKKKKKKKIKEHKKFFTLGNFSNALVIHNISNNHKFVFSYLNIIAFIHDKSKRRIICYFTL